MTAPTCGARTWGDDGPVECLLDAGHEGRHANAILGEWSHARCAVTVCGHVNIWTVDEARAVRDRIQRQLDALDPDAAIAEAERRMLDAFDRRVRLVRMADVHSDSPLDPIDAAAEEAKAAQRVAYDTWLALVEARDAKGGGA